MENLSLCRICLATDVRLCYIANSLQNMYEKLTELKFKREDGRPLVACYLCYARLWNCYRLKTSCLQSEELLTEIMSSGMLTRKVASTNTFRVVSVLHFSVGQEPSQLQNSTECHLKEETPEVLDYAELEQQNIEDIKVEPQEEQIDVDTQCSQLEDPLAVMKREHDDDDTEIKIEPQEEQIDVDTQCSQLEDPLAVMKREHDDDDTGVPALEQLEETDAHLVAETDNINKNIVLNKPIAKSNKKLNKHRDNKVKTHDEDHKQISNCNICSIEKCFRSKADLKSETCSEHDLTQHMYTHTDSKPFTNEYCKKQSPRKSQSTVSHEDELLHIHTDEKQFQCDTCNKRFTKEYCLIRHQKYTHSSEKRFQCEVCSKLFKFLNNLTRHLHTHATDKRFICNVCNKSFTNKRNLTRHIMYIHSSEKRFRCGTCDKCFSNKSKLSDHLYTHTGEKRVKCDKCNKFFTSKFNLKQHLYTHTGEKKFQCDTCKRFFTKKTQLTQHQLIHTGEKPFKCNVCNKCFYRKQYLTRHMHTHK